MMVMRTGGATIWEYKVSDKHKISLYFGFKPTSKNDIKWNGIYPDGYFSN